VAGAEAGVPPVSALSAELYDRFRPEITNPAVKQFVGLCVRAVLDEAGFEVDQPGVRLHKDRVFITGSTYRPKTQETQVSASDDALDRMMRALSEEQALRAAASLERTFPGILRRAHARR
jgi:hypothetical protein